MPNKLLNKTEINIIHGMNLVNGAKQLEVQRLLDHIEGLETILDELDNDDTFGTQGWRYFSGLEDY